MRFPLKIGIFLVYLSNEVLPASSLFTSKLQSNIFRPRAVSKMADEKIALDLLVQKDVKIRKSRKAVISTIITVSYMSIIVSVMALPVCLSAISSDVAFYGAKTNKSYLSEVIFSATMAIVSFASQLFDSQLSPLTCSFESNMLNYSVVTFLKY